METIDDVLEHYGIKGMKWGVRRSDEQLARARGRRKEKGEPVTPTKKSADAKKAAAAKDIAKKEGVGALSNDQLQDLNKRLNLEQQYSKLTTGNKPESLVGMGAVFARDMAVSVAKNQIMAFANQEAGKALKALIETPKKDEEEK